MLLLARFSGKISLGIMESLIFSQLVILVPTIGFLVISRERVGQFIGWKMPKLSVSLLVIVLTYLCMPIIMTVNAVSMLFVDNEVTALSGYLLKVPAWQTLLMVGMIGPVSEEFVFRGVFYHGFKRSGRFLRAMLLSALLFGLTHMNFNQMSYAVVFGVISVFLVEGCGSLFYGMLFHIVINMTNAVQMVLMDKAAATDVQASRQLIEQTMQMPYKQALCVTISVMAVLSTVTTALAVCLYWAIVKKVKRDAYICGLLRAKESGEEKLLSFPLLVAITGCLGYMILDVCMAG